MEPGHDSVRAPAAVRWIARAEVAVVGAILLVSLAITLYAIIAIILIGAVSIVRTQIEIGATDEELFEVPTAIILAGLPLGLAIAIAHLLVEIYAIWRPARAQTT